MGSRLSGIVVGLVLVVFQGFLVAQDCLEPVGRWPYGVSNDVAAKGDVAVLANGAALQVFDLTVPSAPSVIGEVYLPRVINTVAMAGTQAYALTPDHLYVVDIGETPPTQVGDLSGIGSSYSLAVEGRFVYAIGYQSLSIFDVSVPSAPTYRGGLQWADGSPRDIQVSSNHAFVTDSRYGLRVVDVADPTSPVEIGGLDLGAIIIMRYLDVVDGLAYVLGSDTSDNSRRLIVINLADPASPALVSNSVVKGTHDIVVRQGVATVADYWSLWTYDVTDPETPTFLGQGTLPYLPVPEQNQLAAIDGFVLMSAGYHGLGIYDLGDPAAPAHAASLMAPGQIEDAAYTGGTLFIAANSRGFRAVDVSGPALPVELGFTVISQQPQTWGVAAGESMVYASGLTPAGLFALDVIDPTVPVTLGNAPGAYGNWVVLGGEHAYLVDGWNGGIHVVDLSSPGAPALVGSLDLESDNWEWPVVVGDQLIVRDNDNDPVVSIFDVGDPTAPAQIAEIDIRQNVAGLAAVGRWLLVPDIPNGVEPVIRVFDLSDPACPLEVAPYHPHGGVVEAIAVAGSVAYLAVMDFPPIQAGAIEVVDFNDPSAPVFMASRPRAGRVKRFAFGPDEVYVLERNSGFDV